jgi:hypothetical protein
VVWKCGVYYSNIKKKMLFYLPLNLLALLEEAGEAEMGEERMSWLSCICTSMAVCALTKRETVCGGTTV